MATMYMHTMNGRPAAFSEQYKYLYYLDESTPATVLAESLYQIKKQRRIHEKNQASCIRKNSYGYVKVWVPA